VHPRKRAGDRGGESLILKSAKKEKGVSTKKREEGSRIAIRSTSVFQRESSECLFEAEITVFAKRRRDKT